MSQSESHGGMMSGHFDHHTQERERVRERGTIGEFGLTAASP